MASADGWQGLQHKARQFHLFPAHGSCISLFPLYSSISIVPVHLHWSLLLQFPYTKTSGPISPSVSMGVAVSFARGLMSNDAILTLLWPSLNLSCADYGRLDRYVPSDEALTVSFLPSYIWFFFFFALIPHALSLYLTPPNIHSKYSFVPAWIPPE